MNRISIRLLHCLGASVAALACIALSPLAAAATDATAADSTVVTASRFHPAWVHTQKRR